LTLRIRSIGAVTAAMAIVRERPTRVYTNNFVPFDDCLRRKRKVQNRFHGRPLTSMQAGSMRFHKARSGQQRTATKGMSACSFIRQLCPFVCNECLGAEARPDSAVKYIFK
jgi:hypothetical protein